MSCLPRNSQGCPALFLAPMEGVGDKPFRKAMAAIGGFDQASTEFLRVPVNAHCASLAKVYDSKEILPFPLAAQIMGSDPVLMADMARELEKRGAPRIDINCGCPSNTVTGKGAGSSLLKTPEALHEIARAVVNAVKVPVTLKKRIGYSDTTLFKENLHAAVSSGIKFLTLHPRTKEDGYGPPARWEYIAEAKANINIPLVGNGDILSVNDATRMLEYTKCDALMIGRGAVGNPFIFHQIKAHFSNQSYAITKDGWQLFFDTFESELIGPERSKINKFKQILSYALRGHERKSDVMTYQATRLSSFKEAILPLFYQLKSLS